MSKASPKNTDIIGRNEDGTFGSGNIGKPKGATNKTTRELRGFITNFLNDKAFEIPHIWNSLEDKDKASLYLHLCRLVMPKAPEETPEKDPNFSRPIIRFTNDEDLTSKEKETLLNHLIKGETNNTEFNYIIDKMTIDDLRDLMKNPSLTEDNISTLIEKL
jgi:hypothetical protein